MNQWTQARVSSSRWSTSSHVSNVLTADYIGALAAALLFPLVLVPQLGLMGASFLLGAINLAVAAMGLWLFRARCGFALRAAFLLAVLAVGYGVVSKFLEAIGGRSPWAEVVMPVLVGAFVLVACAYFFTEAQTLADAITVI